MEIVHVAQFLEKVHVMITLGPRCKQALPVYLGSADVETQNLSSDFQRLCVENLPYHPETRLGTNTGTDFTMGKQKTDKRVILIFRFLNEIKFSRERIDDRILKKCV